MRVLVALVCVALTFALGACSRPDQAAYAKQVRPDWRRPESRTKAAKFTKASLVRSQLPTSQKRVKPTPVKQDQAISQDTEAIEKSVPPLPSKRPEQAHVIPKQRHAIAIDSPESSHGVNPELEAKFKAAKEKASRQGVESLTSKDIDGLSLEQIKELRGY
jgi:hypothetical protein